MLFSNFVIIPNIGIEIIGNNNTLYDIWYFSNLVIITNVAT
jgi:hypothetical protein